MNARTDDAFDLDPTLTYLNHASFGCPTVAALDRVADERRRIERDTATALGPELTARLREGARAVERRIGTDPGSVALVANTTEAAAAVSTSAALRHGDRVLVLDVEYSSVVRGWQVACQRAGAELVVVPLRLPATADDVLTALDDASAGVTTVLVSAITSSTALSLPVERIARWAQQKRIELVVDAAHVVGHTELDLSGLPCAAVIGSLHKWLPVPRPVGFLWLAPHLRDVVRPAATSLHHDSDDLVERFGWRGTWDPAPALGLVAAFAEADAWQQAGDLAAAACLADDASSVLMEHGLVPTGDAAMLPPRLRAFLCPGTTLAALDEVLGAARIRAWTGSSADGRTLLRVSTHVYNDEADLERLAGAIERLPARR